MSIEYSIASLFARTAYGIRPGLEVITALLERLGNPQRGLKCIHVAGTNGKGSVCAMIESVLRASGLKTGLYTSPHLFRFNERFRINGQMIADPALERLIADVEEAARGIPLRPATFFEISTAMAFEHFRREKTDCAVIETGMGGRWDATNVVQPLLSVITRIDTDHTDYLGAEIEKIAGEKAGIIKARTPVICGPMPAEAEAVIYREAEQKQAPVMGSAEAVFVRALESDPAGQRVDIETGERTIRGVRLPLAGGFQLENCGIAVAALDWLEEIAGRRLRIKEGLEAVRWPGRFQKLQDDPPVLYDGAHNVNGCAALRDALAGTFPGYRCGLVLAFMKDKDVDGMLRTLAPAAARAWALTLPGERALSAEAIAEAGRKAGMKIEPASSPQPALDWLAADRKRLVCFAGSLYLAEELRKHGWFHA